jgi:hypothetical protein
MCGETGGMLARASRCHGTRIEQVASFAHVPQNVSRKDKGRRKEKRKRKRKKKKNFSQTYIHIHRWTLIINKKKKLVDKGLGSALLVRSAPHFSGRVQQFHIVKFPGVKR